ncbi:MAG: hypothetical protein R3Y13_01820 [bacterium]
MLDEIKSRCLAKLALEPEDKKFQLIYTILEEEDCFTKMPYSYSYKILEDLNFNNPEALLVELLSPKNQVSRKIKFDTK